MKKALFSLFIAASCFGSDIKIGGNYTYVSLTPDQFESFEGNLGGVQASFEYCEKGEFYEGLTFLWREGSLDGADPLKRSLFNIDTQVRLGYTAGFWRNCMSTLFTGFGWQYISQNLTGGGTPLKLNYNEVYIPVGLLNQCKWGRFSLGLNGIWMPQIFPNVNFIPLDNARWVTACTLANFLVEVPFIYRTSFGDWDGLIELKPFFQYWQDGKTLSESSAGVPLGLVGNTYYMGGFQLNIGLDF